MTLGQLFFWNSQIANKQPCGVILDGPYPHLFDLHHRLWYNKRESGGLP